MSYTVTLLRSPKSLATKPCNEIILKRAGTVDSPEREIATTEAEIDNLIYQLCGTVIEEHKISEGTLGPDGARGLSGRNPSCAGQAVRLESAVPVG